MNICSKENTRNRSYGYSGACGTAFPTAQNFLPGFQLDCSHLGWKLFQSWSQIVAHHRRRRWCKAYCCGLYTAPDSQASRALRIHPQLQSLQIQVQISLFLLGLVTTNPSWLMGLPESELWAFNYGNSKMSIFSASLWSRITRYSCKEILQTRSLSWVFYRKLKNTSFVRPPLVAVLDKAFVVTSY